MIEFHSFGRVHRTQENSATDRLFAALFGKNLIHIFRVVVHGKLGIAAFVTQILKNPF